MSTTHAIAPSVPYALGVCTLGTVLVAGGEGGVRAILLGDDPHELIEDLADRCGDVSVVLSTWMQPLVSRVIAYLERPTRELGFELDLRGTSFQQQVWSALREIPPGRTMSYAELAAAIGRPGSARAVAGACAANPLAVVVPCHRVVAADGSLSGYRWGIERKRALLDREARNS